MWTASPALGKLDIKPTKGGLHRLHLNRHLVNRRLTLSDN